MSKIRDNLHTLQKPNQLQDKQIKHLAKYLNLTVHQVSRHGEMLYEMDSKMFIIINTIQDIMWSIDFLQYDYTISRLEFTKCIHHFMPLEEMWTHYMNT